MVTTDTKPTDGQTSDLVKSEETKIKLELLKPFILETPDGDISETGQSEIEWAISSAGHPSLPANFEWKWLAGRGTLPKRIQSYLYKEHQIKASPELIANIGNLGKMHASKAGKVVLDFTEKLDWSDGAFGDGGSCFWGEKSGARDMIEEHAYAVRGYKVREGHTMPATSEELRYPMLRGYARAWVADIGDNRLVVFNGYGENTLTFARWLALFFSCTYKRIDLTNNGLDDGVLWINGACGYLIGAHSKIELISRHDFGWPERSGYICEICDERIPEDEEYTAWTSRGSRITACHDCVSECPNCGEYYTYDVAQLMCNACREEEIGKRIKACRETVEELEDKVNEAKEALAELEEKVSGAKDELADAERELEDARKELGELESEVKN